MHIICLTPVEEGVYNDHSAEHITMPKEGEAYIPEPGDPVPLEWAGRDIDYTKPSTFPRLGLLEAEELTYTREIEGEREVIKTRPVESLDEDGNTVIVTEEYTETEMVMETHEYKMMTVTAMTEGTLPEPAAETPSQLDMIEAQVTYTALMTDTLLEV